MTRKAIAMIGTGAALAATIGGMSLAQLTSDDAETNTFTAGNVSIALNEQQRALDADGNKTTDLEDFEQDKKLLPIVGSAQGEKDALGMPIAKNYVDKLVTVTNDGTEDAYVRAYFAIPSSLDDGFETFNAGKNVLHFNFGNDDQGTTFDRSWQWMKDGQWRYFETDIDGIHYNVYYANYAEKLAPGATTSQFVSGVYLDTKVDYDAEGNMILRDRKRQTVEELNLDFNPVEDGIKCPVFSIAVQAEGYDSADAAFDAVFGANYNPWEDAVSNTALSAQP